MKAHLPCLTVIGLLWGLVAGTASAFETVVIDAGHGGNDEGTKWYRVAEKDVTLAVSKKLAALLRGKGITVVETRTDDRYVSLDERAEIANRTRNSLLVSLHFNATRTYGVSGFQTYHFHASPSGAIIAHSLQNAMAETLCARSRGVMKNDYAVLARTNDLAVLVECGFISNKNEALYYATSQGQDSLAHALALGIMRVKPVINHDPPSCEDAKCAIYAKKAREAERRLALSGRAKADPPAAPAKAAPLLSLLMPLRISEILVLFEHHLAKD